MVVLDLCASPRAGSRRSATNTRASWPRRRFSACWRPSAARGIRRAAARAPLALVRAGRHVALARRASPGITGLRAPGPGDDMTRLDKGLRAAVHSGRARGAARRLQRRRQDAPQGRGGDQWHGLPRTCRRRSPPTTSRGARPARGRADDARIHREGIPGARPAAGRGRRLPPGRRARRDHGQRPDAVVQQGCGRHGARATATTW